MELPEADEEGVIGVGVNNNMDKGQVLDKIREAAVDYYKTAGKEDFAAQLLQ